jgi:hypothetical protein
LAPIDATARARTLPLLAGILTASALLAAGYARVAAAAKAPGDWLFLVRDVQGAATWSPPGSLFAWCVEAVGLWSMTPGTQRAIGFLGAWLGVLAVALVLWRLPRPSALGIVTSLAVLGLLPWARHDASDLAGAGQAFAPLLASVPLLLRGTGRSTLAALAGGALAGALAGPCSLLGEMLLALGLAWAAGARGIAAFGPALAFGVTAHGVPAFLGAQRWIPASAEWWTDVGLASQVPAGWMQTGLLVLIAAVWLMPERGRQWLGVAALASAMAVAGTGMSRFLDRQAVLARDVESFGRDATASVYVNLPAHVRGYALALLASTSGSDKQVLATLDTGVQLHVPFGHGWPPGEWMPSSAWDGPRVRRWTARGFIEQDWRQCLETEAPPLVLAATEVARLAAPLAMLAGGRLAAMPGWTAAPTAEAGVRLRGSAAETTRLAVLLLPARPVQTFADPGFLAGGLRRGWFDPPWPPLRLSGPAAARLRLVGWAPGWGPLLEVAAGAEPVDCTVAVDR